MRVLFISKSIHDVSGAGVGSRMHLNVLKKLVGEENVYVVDVGVSETACREEKYIAYGKYHGVLDRLNRCLEGNTYLFSNKIIGDICQLIKNESISFVFVDDSYYGNLVKTIKEKCDAVAVVTFFHDVKPSRFMILTICYFAYLIVITFIYHNKAADIHLIISNLKIVFMLCVIEYLLKRTPNSTINIMFFILITFVIIDFASIVLFPNGLYQTEQIWNEWSSSQEAQWIYGNKNNRVYWYAVLSIITWLRYVFNNKSKVMVLITSGISIVAMMLVKSSTATIVAILVSVGFFYLTYKKQTNINMNSYGILVIYGCITVLILLGSTSLLKPFVEGVLHKDMTFTGRSIAWERVLLLIASKPVFGWGVVDGETATGLLKSIAFVNPHNQLLDCLWQGGIILVFILSLIMITIASNITKIPNRSKRTGIQFVWIGLLIDMIFEVLLGTGATWIWLLLINHLYEFVYEREVS